MAVYIRYTVGASRLSWLTGLGVVLLAGPSWGYNLRKNADGKVLIWRADTVKVLVDVSAAPEVARDPDAVRAGFASWTSAGVTTRVELEVSGEALPAGNDGRNVVRWEAEDWGFGREVVATTVSTFERGSGFVVDSDILFNGVHHAWTNLPEEAGREYDVQNVMTHEAGHFLGLGHEETDGEATMYPTTPPSETKKRSLGDDDLDAIIALVREIGERTAADGASWAEAGVSRETGEGVLPARDAMGCSAGPSGRPASGANLLVCAGLVLLGLACRARRAFVKVLVLLGVLVQGLPAGATILEGLTLDQLTDRAEVVVRGQVVGSAPVRVGRLVFTEYELASATCLKGPCEARPRVRVPGGELGGGLVMHVDGVSQLDRGQDVVLFVRRGPAAGLSPVGLSQGAFTVSGSDVVRDLSHVALIVTGEAGSRRIVPGGLTRMSLAELEARVRSRVSAPMSLESTLELRGARLGAGQALEIRHEQRALGGTLTPRSQLVRPSSRLLGVEGPALVPPHEKPLQ